MNRGGQRTIRFDLQLQRSIPSSIILWSVWAGWVSGWGSTVVGKLQCAHLNESHQEDSRVLEVSDQ